MPRMLYVTNAHIPSPYAHVVQTLKMCDAFAAQGWEVALLALRPFVRHLTPWQEVARDFRLSRRFSFLPFPISYQFPRPGLARHSVARSKVSHNLFLGYNLCLFYFFAGLLSLANPRYDLIFTCDYFFALLLACFHPGLLRKTCVEFHFFPSSAPSRALALALAHRLAGLVVVTGEIRRDFIDLGVNPEKILVAHNGVSLNDFAETEDSPSREEAVSETDRAGRIGYVGRLVTMGKEKGVGCLLEAMAHLIRAGHSNASLTLVGGPEELIPTLRRRAAELGLDEGHVSFVGQVPHAAVAAHLRALDVLVLPFPSDPHFGRQASPMKVFEYMAAGKPIVASSLPAIGEVLRDGENALLVPPDDPRALARGIARVLDDRALAEGLGRQARRQVQQYTWEARAANIVRFMSHRLT